MTNILDLNCSGSGVVAQPSVAIEHEESNSKIKLREKSYERRKIKKYSIFR